MQQYVTFTFVASRLTGQLADKPTRGQSSRGLDNSRSGQLADNEFFTIANFISTLNLTLTLTLTLSNIDYCKLFDVLVQRKLSPIFLRLLLNMYTSHVTRIMWNGVFSERFLVKNGVKQGGVLSLSLIHISEPTRPY